MITKVVLASRTVVLVHSALSRLRRVYDPSTSCLRVASTHVFAIDIPAIQLPQQSLPRLVDHHLGYLSGLRHGGWVRDEGSVSLPAPRSEGALGARGKGLRCGPVRQSRSACPFAGWATLEVFNEVVQRSHDDV